MTYFQLFLQNFFLEWLLLIALFYRKGFMRVSTVTLLANAITHPLVVFGFLAIPQVALWKALLAAEIFAIVVEAAIYAYAFPTRWYIALGAALLANLLSWEISPRLSFILMKYGWFF